MVQMTILAAAVAVVSFFSLGPRRKFVGKPPFFVTSLSRLVLLGSVPLRDPQCEVYLPHGQQKKFTEGGTSPGKQNV